MQCRQCGAVHSFTHPVRTAQAKLQRKAIGRQQANSQPQCRRGTCCIHITAQRHLWQLQQRLGNSPHKVHRNLVVVR